MQLVALLESILCLILKRKKALYADRLSPSLKGSFGDIDAPLSRMELLLTIQFRTAAVPTEIIYST